MRPAFFFMMEGTHSRNRTRNMNGSSSFITLSVYVMGRMTAERPPTSTKFSISAPMIFPRESEECFFLKAVREVTSSGSEVPSATNVREMIDSGTWITRASFGPYSRRNPAPM